MQGELRALSASDNIGGEKRLVNRMREGGICRADAGEQRLGSAACEGRWRRNFEEGRAFYSGVNARKFFWQRD